MRVTGWVVGKWGFGGREGRRKIERRDRKDHRNNTIVNYVK